MFSKKTYETGVVIVTCPGCKGNHLIADRLGWFGEPGSIEDYLNAQGQGTCPDPTNCAEAMLKASSILTYNEFSTCLQPADLCVLELQCVLVVWSFDCICMQVCKVLLHCQTPFCLLTCRSSKEDNGWNNSIDCRGPDGLVKGQGTSQPARFIAIHQLMWFQALIAPAWVVPSGP